MKPYHFQVPLAYQAKQSLDGFTLYLDVNNHNIIEGLFFTGPTDSPWIPVFSELCRLSEGQRLFPGFPKDIQLTSPAKRWNLPLWLLRMVSREFFQTNQPHHEMAGHRDDELICRCFGVYLPQILAWSSLKEVTDETRAGGGCAQCHQHIQHLIRKAAPPPPAISPQEFDKIKTLTAVFIKNNFPSCSLELLNVQGDRMMITFSGEQSLREKVLPLVEKLIEQNFQQKIFLDDSA